MIRNIQSALVPVYLLLCIILGGSAQGIWGNLSLQLLGVVLIAYAAVIPSKIGRQARPTALYWLLLAGLLVAAIQLIPLPPTLWVYLPGREQLARGFDALGAQRPSLPISKDPFNSVLTLFAAIPAIASFTAMEKMRSSPRLLAFAVIAATVLAVLMGAVQVAGGPGSWAYLYKFTNRGAVGFFANQNHMSTLLLVTIPLTIALIHSRKPGRNSSAAGGHWVAIVFLCVVLAGVVLNGSLAAYALVVPVLLASAAMGPTGSRWRRPALLIAALAVAGGVAVLVSSPMTRGADGSGASHSVASRLEIWTKTSEAIRESFPTGSGLGSFEQVYRQHEDPMKVTREYVNHAHNDYLELVSDLGVAGALLVGAFLLWWIITAVRVWQSHLSTPFAKASTILTAAVLVHSIVDFPLRTAAISAIFGASIALMARERLFSGHDRGADGARHVKLG